MQLSRESLQNLSCYSDSNIFNEASYKASVELAFEVAKGGSSSASAPTSVQVKQAYTAAVSLILEAAKHDAAPSEITATLEEAKFSDARSKTFVSLYEKNKSAIRNNLLKSSFSFLSVIGVEWRMDYYMRSDLLEQVQTPVYFISLRTQKNDGSEGTVEFTCNLQELQDLLAKLKDATKQVKNKLQQQS